MVVVGLGGVRTGASLAVTEGSEWRKEEAWVEDCEADACNTNHPWTC